MIIVLVPRTFIRFYSVRTGQTLLNANRLEGALIVYGDARPDRYNLSFDGSDVRIDGTLWDRVAPAISFGKDGMRLHTKVLTRAVCLRTMTVPGSETVHKLPEF